MRRRRARPRPSRRQMGGEQYTDKLSAQTEGSDRLLAKIKESLDPLISADTRESGSNHWLLVALRNTKAARALRGQSRHEVRKWRRRRGGKRERAKKTKQNKKTSELTFLQWQDEENFCSGSPQRGQIPGRHIQGCLSADLQQLIRSIKS